MSEYKSTEMQGGSKFCSETASDLIWLAGATARGRFEKKQYR